LEDNASSGRPRPDHGDQQHPPSRQHGHFASEFREFNAERLQIALLCAGEQNFRYLWFESL
jgi:hypothetical protein